MMNITAILFYIFSGFLLGASIMVVASKNTVHGVLFLILAFFNAAALFIIANAEFLAMMLIIVYVGAVAVLFLFVVMMLNIGSQKLKEFSKPYMLTGAFVGAILAAELVLLIMTWVSNPLALDLMTAPYPTQTDISNTQALGDLLYTRYFLIFQGAGLILLVAMVGAIILTFRQREGVKKQKIKEQIKRTPQESIRLVNIPRNEDREGISS